jgi:uncharacterized RDD family membrane protein YckC
MNYAGFWIRVGALVVDSIIQWTLALSLWFFFMITAGEIGIAIAVAINAVLTLFYEAYFTSRNWYATPGKKAVGIEVMDTNYQPLGFGVAMGRSLLKLANLFTFGLGYLMVAFTDKKQGLHDKLAGTLVVKRDKPHPNFINSADLELGGTVQEKSFGPTTNSNHWIMAGFTTSGHVVRFSIDFSSLRLREPGIFFGRDPSQSDFHIRDDSVSRKHAVITLENGTLFVRDLDSTNGTYVNDKRIDRSEKRRLNPEDTIQFGNVILSIGKD